MTADFDQLMLKVLVFVDRNGQVVSKDGNPMYSSLAMRYEQDNLHIDIHAQANAQGNGSCSARVDAGGSYITGPFKWQKLVGAKS